ncbi:homoserine kinase [Zongyangia hominis]|uniref:Homoserine kinase n=1 Tax=Zongyangia hominis TaxID=2763677 RepID=A0A926ECX2_9FIRM|nr:homoserine kinase [Zongyangia hominis]MBC8569457.1 homoserine kinase [Zongyangia hominis]
MIQVRIPATSANIGSGFDSLGLALNLYNYIYMEQIDGIEIKSRDHTQVPTGENNLIYKTAKHLFEICGKPFTGLHIEQENNIPMTRGLGSSSACIVGGLFGANTLMGNPLSREELVNFAAVMEGHPDNSTPAILGGLVTAVIDDGKVYCVKQEITEKLRFFTFIPDFEMSTEMARAALPKVIDHRDGVFNLSRAALMSVSLYSGNFQNLKIAAQDKLHQPYRLGLIQDGDKVFDLAYELGAYAAYISGAGSTLMAIVDEAQADTFEKEARAALDRMGHASWELKKLMIDNLGTQVSV